MRSGVDQRELRSPRGSGRKFRVAILDAALWGMGVDESDIPAAVAPVMPQLKRRSAFAMFTAG